MEKHPLPANKTSAWLKLKEYSKSFEPDLRALFENDPGRPAGFSVSTEHIHFDYSRQLVNARAMKLLFDLAEKRNLRSRINDMFSGRKINVTEERSVLHVALRNDSMLEVKAVLDQIKAFSGSVLSGKRKGATGKKLVNIVSIGIGGSYLGPEYLAEACAPFAKEGMKLVFVANVDGTDFVKKTKGLDPEETLVIVVSKTFTTAETMKNAETAKGWLLKGLQNHPEAVKKHFAAVSTAKDKVEAFGIDPENMFGFWDWVGGRFSATSAVGALPLSLYLGFENFKKILDGARWMDEHFRTSPCDKNIPVLSALLDVWNINFLGYKSRALLPYSQGLAKLPAHTQQVEMESNGKSVDLHGRPVKFDTGEVVFGEPGTNGQHSFYQLIHQGTQVVPCDFIGFIRPQYPLGKASDTAVTHHEELMTNFFAQPDALAFGKTDDYLPKNFSGNRPSSSLLLPELNPFAAGLLLAWTEHRAAAKGFIWEINSFDQFGVELGKKLGVKVREEMLKRHKDRSYKVSAKEFPASADLINAFFEGKLP